MQFIAWTETKYSPISKSSSLKVVFFPFHVGLRQHKYYLTIAMPSPSAWPSMAVMRAGAWLSACAATGGTRASGTGRPGRRRTPRRLDARPATRSPFYARRSAGVDARLHRHSARRFAAGLDALLRRKPPHRRPLRAYPDQLHSPTVKMTASPLTACQTAKALPCELCPLPSI